VSTANSPIARNAPDCARVAHVKRERSASKPQAVDLFCGLGGWADGLLSEGYFGGAGTTGLVADRLQRNAILIELNPDYAEMARKRINGDAPLFAEVQSA
jgi:hypothetical protein